MRKTVDTFPQIVEGALQKSNLRGVIDLASLTRSQRRANSARRETVTPAANARNAEEDLKKSIREFASKFQRRNLSRGIYIHTDGTLHYPADEQYNEAASEQFEEENEKNGESDDTVAVTHFS